MLSAKPLAVALSVAIVGLLSSLPVLSQTSHVGHKSRIWLIDASEVTVAPAPGKQQTMQELAAVKDRLAKNNARSIEIIRYWDAGSPAYRWNEMASRMLSLREIDVFLRTPTAWMNMAIEDATTAAWKAKDLYQRKRPSQLDASIKTVVDNPMSSSFPCEHTVTAAAAATVLAYFFPQRGDSILRLAKQAADSRVNAGVQFPSDVEAAWKLGEQVARKVIEHAKNDGSANKWSGSMNTDPKKWRGDFPVGAVVSTYKPIVIKAADQFRPPAPPDFAAEMEEMKNFKQDLNSMYTAMHWANASGVDIWNQLASQKIFENRLDRDARASAHIYATLHVAIHDASIAIMDAKYAYWGIRPFQYDSAFKPLLVFTPPFPGYPSGHATASSVAATVLGHFFPADAEYFSKLAKECADSRFYGGIHFRTDNETGLVMGRSLGDYIYQVRGK